MIENIRKYRIALLIGLVLVILGLVVGLREDAFNRGGGTSLFRINGRTYGLQDFQRLGASSLELVYGLAGSGDMKLYEFAALMSDAGAGEKDPAEKFFIHRMVLRDAMKHYGIHPGEDVISARIREMPAFATQEGQFDDARFRTFVTKHIGRMGLTEGDLRDLTADVIGFEKIKQIVGGGLETNRAAIAHAEALSHQRVSGHIAQLERAKYESASQPTEEDLKTFWENIQDAFRTDEKRDFSYVLVTPDLPKADASATEKESIADATLSEEAKKKKAEEKAKQDAEITEKRRLKQLETDQAVDDFVYELEQRKGADFEQLAKARGWEIKRSGMFVASAPPADFALPLRASSRGGNAVSQLFQMKVGTDSLSKISPPLAVGDGQWLVARYEGNEESRIKTFEEAKNEVRAQYITEKAQEEMAKAAKESLAKIKELTATGQSFAEAAKAAGIEKNSDFTDVSSRPEAGTQPQALFETVAFLDPGSFAEPLIEDDRAFLIQLTKREVVKEANAAERLQQQVENAATRNQSIAMIAWLTNRTTAADVQDLSRTK